MLLGLFTIELNSRKLLLSEFAFGDIELTENIDLPMFPFKSIPEVWILLIWSVICWAKSLISLVTESTKL